MLETQAEYKSSLSVVQVKQKTSCCIKQKLIGRILVVFFFCQRCPISCVQITGTIVLRILVLSSSVSEADSDKMVAFSMSNQEENFCSCLKTFRKSQSCHDTSLSGNWRPCQGMREVKQHKVHIQIILLLCSSDTSV